MVLELDDNLSLDVSYDVINDEIKIFHIEITEGSVLELLEWFGGEAGFDSLVDHLADKVNDNLLLGFGELDEEDEV